MFPDLKGYLQRRRQPQKREEGRGYPAFGVRTVESLEGRLLLSSAVLSSGVLTVTGDSDGSGENIEVYRITSSGIFVKVNGTQVGGTFIANNVNRIDVNGLADDDTITIGRNLATGSGNTGVGKNTKLFGGDGADSLIGGDNNDTITGGDGNDYCRGYDSDDTLYGGYGGNDTCLGDDQNDLLYGGDPNYGGGDDEIGDDDLYGNDGNDTIYGQKGNDYIDPGSGNDFAYGGLGDDTFINAGADSQADSLDGGAGTDSIGSDFDLLDTVTGFEL